MDKLLLHLREALCKKDAEAIEYLIDENDFSKDCVVFVEILCQLLEENWHIKHEDIALILQEAKDARAIEALYNTAQKKLDYLDYDDTCQLSRKCIWALWQIGTEEAVEKIKLLAESNDKVIGNYAIKQLNRVKN